MCITLLAKGNNKHNQNMTSAFVWLYFRYGNCNMFSFSFALYSITLLDKENNLSII